MLGSRVTLVWALLVVATGTSWALGSDHGVGSSTASVSIFAVAFAKVRLVGRHFMELRGAPVLLGRAFDAYCVLACACLVGVYAWA